MQSKELREDSQSLKKKRSRRNPKQRKLKRRNRRRTLNSFPPSNFYSMNHPNCRSFWDSYARAFQWQKSFLLSYWKNQAESLFQENQLLKQKLTTPSSEYLPNENSEIILETGHSSLHDELSEEEDFEIEVSEEFQQFMEISLKHKAERTLSNNKCVSVPSSKNNLSSTSEDCTGPPDEQVGLRRIKDMKLLYGKDSPKIIGMETAIQLNFIRKNDKRKPVFWPVVPLSQVTSNRPAEC